MDVTEVKKLLQMYFDAGFEADGEKMSKVFHDDAHVYGHGENSVLFDMDMKFFINIIGAQDPPDSQKPDFVRYEEILSIDFTGEDTAVARVKLRLGDVIYTDVLSIIRLDGKLKVISKLYAGVPV